MALADQLESEHHDRNIHLKRCPIFHLLEVLSEPDRATLLEALNNDMYQHVVIAKALQADGHHVSQFAVGRHRREACSCP